MSTGIGLIILAQALLALFVIWGFMHEDRFIRFERRLAEKRAATRRTKKSRAKLRLVVDRAAQEHPDFTAA